MHKAPRELKIYGTPLNDVGYSIAKTYDGCYIVSGTTTYDMGNKDINLQHNFLNGLLFFKRFEDGVGIGAVKVLFLNN